MKFTHSERGDYLQCRGAWGRLAALVLFIFAIGAGFVVLQLSELSFTSGDKSNWMPQGTPERKILDRFNERFGAKDMLLLSWDGCKASDPLLGELTNLIEQKDQDNAKVDDRPAFFEKISSYQTLRESLSSEFWTKEELDNRVKKSLRGFLVGKTDDTGMIVLEGTEYCAENRMAALDFVEQVTHGKLGSSVELKFGGPAYLSVSASETTRRTLLTVAPLVSLLGFLVSLIMLRNFAMTMACFTVSGLAALFSMGAIHFAGKSMGDLLVVVPSLSQLLAMSNAIHLFNYYAEDYLKHGNSNRSWRYAIRVGWLPTVAATVTTIVGFAALGSSNLQVAKDFAIFGGMAVGISALTVLIVMPALLILMKPKINPPNWFETGFVNGLDWITNYLRWPVTLGMSALLITGAYGIRLLDSDVRLENFFGDGSEFVENFDWYSEHFAAPQVSELMVTFPANPDGEDFQDDRTKLKFIDQLANDIGAIDEEYALFNPNVFACGLPDGPELLFLPTAGPQDIYTQVVDAARDAGWIARDSEGEHWRISIRHPPEPTPHQSKFLRELKPILENACRDIEPAPKLILTGEYQLFSNSQDGLLRQLLRSFLLAFVIITPLIIIFLRSFRTGLIAILGNVFPLVVFFGIMGWAGNRIDIATMTIAAVAFGIAVDDTVHFLTWLGRGFKEENKTFAAVRYAFNNSAVAILQTTMILSIGMMGYLMGEFAPSVRFATSSAAVLVLALFGDLLFLPAVIRCFCKRPVAEMATDETTESALLSDPPPA